MSEQELIQEADLKEVLAFDVVSGTDHKKDCETRVKFTKRKDGYWTLRGFFKHEGGTVGIDETRNTYGTISYVQSLQRCDRCKGVVIFTNRLYPIGTQLTFNFNE